MPRVGIIMGSDSDLPIMARAATLLDELAIDHETTIVSAHRTPRRLVDYAGRARTRGLQVIIAGAGGAAHLPGMVASLTTLPVIGVPIRGSVLEGLDSLLSIVQMPRGVPVATVAINNAENAALLAARILSLGDAGLADRLASYAAGMESEVMEKATRLESEGPDSYLRA